MSDLLDKIKLNINLGIKDIIELDDKIIFYFNSNKSISLDKDNENEDLVPHIINNQWYIGKLNTNYKYKLDNEKDKDEDKYKSNLEIMLDDMKDNILDEITKCLNNAANNMLNEINDIEDSENN